MNIQLKSYNQQNEGWPQAGHHIMAQYDAEKIIVYQSYRPAIGHFAANNQHFGGPFSLNRMTWIKPNFLWMMFRNGWGQKVGQEVVLAIHLKLEAFEQYLANAVHSTFQSDLFPSREAWQEAVANSNVRLQWDPDHDPYGDKLERRAVQIGLRNEFIRSYAEDDLLEIEDISDYVAEQYQFVQQQRLDLLQLPFERPLTFSDAALNSKLGINHE